MQRNSLTSAVAAGLSGTAATLPMTLVMMLIEKAWKDATRPLPPERVVGGVLDKVPSQTLKQENLKRHQIFGPLSILAHLGYGSTMGALYSFFSRSFPNWPYWLKGSSFGLGVWIAGYWGWLPVLNILPPPQKVARAQNVNRFVSHLVWGLALAYIYSRVERQSLRQA